MHLSLQMQAEKKAEDAILAWAKEADVRVDSIRYHLLRNGLILKGIEIERGDDVIAIDHVLVRANPTLLTGAAPRIAFVAISGAQLELHYQQDSYRWQQDERLQRIWQAVGDMRLEDALMSLYLGDESASPLTFNDVRLNQQLRGEQLSVALAASFHGAPIRMQWQRRGGAFSVGEGVLEWRDVDASLLATTGLHLGAAEGNLTGELSWHVGQGEAIELDGSMHLDPEYKGKRIQRTRLAWKGVSSSQGWEMQLNGMNWPLAGWSDYLPKIEGRRLMAGWLDGELLWKQEGDNESLQADKITVGKLAFADSETDRNHWQIETVGLKKMLLEPSRRTFSAKEVVLEEPVVTLNPLDGGAGRTSSTSLWRVRSDRVDVRGLVLRALLKDGEVQFSGLDGSCRVSAKGDMTIALQGQPDGADDSWQLEGELRQHGGRIDRARLAIHGENVALTKLRPLLPLDGSQFSRLSLDGTASLAVEARYRNGNWQLSGKSSSEDLLFSNAGNRWMADRIEVTFGPVGTGLERQHITSLLVDGWSYVVPLNPMGAHVKTQVGNMPDRPEMSWWAESLRDGKWEIETLNWRNGTFSVGHPDSYWMTDSTLTIAPLAIDKESKVMLQGAVGDGTLNIEGVWSPLAILERFSGSLKVEDATPFFLAEWMSASGMPKPVRGRISTSLEVEDDKKGAYSADLTIQLHRALTEQGVAARDPMITRAGFNTVDLLQRLENEKGSIDISIPLSGRWEEAPLGMKRLGDSLLQSLREAAARPFTVASVTRPNQSKVATRIRLRERGALTLNERVRLLKVARKVRMNRKLVVDLVPKWSGEQLSRETMRRIAHTHNLIGRYLNYRGVEKQRIFPMAVTSEDRAGEIASIWVVVSSRK